MNRILIASAFALGLSGAALAQEAPYYAGNYGAAVQTQINEGTSGANASQMITSEADTMTTAAISDGPVAASTQASELNVYDAWQASAGR